MENRIRTFGNRLEYRAGEEILSIEPWGRDGLRVRATKPSAISDRPWALIEPVESGARIELDEICDGCGRGRENWQTTEIPSDGIVEHFTAKIF